VTQLEPFFFLGSRLGDIDSSEKVNKEKGYGHFKCATKISLSELIANLLRNMRLKAAIFFFFLA